MRYAIAVVLLCIAAALAFSMRKNKNNPSSIYAKSLLRVRSVQILPVISLVYAFFAVVVVFFGLLIVDSSSQFAKHLKENEMRISMAAERLSMFRYLKTGKTKDMGHPLIMVRGREEVRKEHPKVLVVGDSFVWGDGCTNINQIWWSILQSELERRGYDCKVYAAGLGGASTYDEFLWLRDTTLIEDIEPDLMIIGYVTNDLDLGNLNHEQGVPPYVQEAYSQWIEANKKSYHREKSLVRELLPALSTFTRYKRLSRNGTNSIYEDAEMRMAGGEYLKYYNACVLEPLGKFIGQIGIPTIVIPTPESPHGQDFAALYRNVLPLFEQAGLPVHNPLGKFIERYPKPDRKFDKYFMAFPTDYHPGPATSWFLGEYAADVLEQEYASMLGKKGERDKAKFTIEINDWFPFMLEPKAIQESGSIAQYAIEYPDQTLEADIKNWTNLNFLSYPLGKNYVKLNFKYPVKLSSIQIEGEYLRSAKVYTLGLNLDLGFDDQKPVSLGYRRGTSCTWKDISERYVTSLLISAKTKDGRQAPLTITIESDGGEEAFY